MRRLFFALLFVNIAYFAWAHFVDVPPAPKGGGAIAQLPSVKLIEELPQLVRAVATPPPPPDPAACFSVGPFGDVDNSAKAAAVMKAKGFDPRQRAEAGETSAGYGVFVGGLATQAEADQALVNIEKNGIRDAILLPATGDGPRRISLGLFSERARAEKRAQLARTMGFKAEVAERKLPTAVYWVDVAPQAGQSTIPIQDLFAEGMSSRIAVQPCPAAVKTVIAAGAAPATAPAPGPQSAQVAGTSKPQ